MTTAHRPLVLGIGGSTRDGSSSEAALEIALAAARSSGARTMAITGRALMLPIYDTESSTRTPDAVALLRAVEQCDGLIISTPGYHGGMSGMIKNALDYLEDLRAEPRPYLEGLPVGCISVAYGWQAAVSTLNGLRTTVHALRGWPSPYGAAVNAVATPVGGERTTDAAVVAQLALVAQQVTTMATATVPTTEVTATVA